jgi:hypothetical protein
MPLGGRVSGRQAFCDPLVRDRRAARQAAPASRLRHLRVQSGHPRRKGQVAIRLEPSGDRLRDSCSSTNSWAALKFMTTRIEVRNRDTLSIGRVASPKNTHDRHPARRVPRRAAWRRACERGRAFIRCPACSGWIDCRDLAQVFEHEGPLPHPA